MGVARILPVSVAAVALSVVVGGLDASLRSPTVFAADATWADANTNFGALLFLSGGYWPTFQLNPPFWSLCYEVWFYGLFGAAIFLKGRQQALYLALLCIAAGPRVLLLLPCWLFGVALHRRGKGLPLRWSRVGLALGLASLAVAAHAAEPLLHVLTQVAPWNLGYSLYALSDTIVAACIAIGLTGLRTLTEHGWNVPARLRPGIHYFAAISSLYVMHWPVLKLLCVAGASVGSSPVALLLVMIIVIAASALFASVTEHKRPVVRAWLDRRFEARALVAS